MLGGNRVRAATASDQARVISAGAGVTEGAELRGHLDADRSTGFEGGGCERSGPGWGSSRDPRPGERGPGAPRGTLPAEPAAAPSRCTAWGGRVRPFPGGLAWRRREHARPCAAGVRPAGRPRVQPPPRWLQVRHWGNKGRLLGPESPPQPRLLRVLGPDLLCCEPARKLQ